MIKKKLGIALLLLTYISLNASYVGDGDLNGYFNETKVDKDAIKNIEKLKNYYCFIRVNKKESRIEFWSIDKSSKTKSLPAGDEQIEWVLPLGEHVTYFFNSSPKITAGGYKKLNCFKNLKIFSVYGPGFTDDSAGILPSFQKLEQLSIENCSITGKTMKKIAEIKNLRNLNLSKSTISDDDLKYLKGMKNLKNLTLSGTAITDDGLKILSELNLPIDFLDISNTGITDAGAQYMKNMKHIMYLDIAGTKISKKMTVELDKALYTPEKKGFMLIDKKQPEPIP